VLLYCISEAYASASVVKHEYQQFKHFSVPRDIS